jgi:hypothetical protein
VGQGLAKLMHYYSCCIHCYEVPGSNLFAEEQQRSDKTRDVLFPYNSGIIAIITSNISHLIIFSFLGATLGLLETDP